MVLRVLKKVIFTTLALSFFNEPSLLSQQLHNTWFRGTVEIPIKTKFSVDTELQHRRQSAFNTTNFIGESLLVSYRNWIHYFHSPHIKFSVSPFAYLHHNGIVQLVGESPTKSIQEFRFSVAGELKQMVFTNFYLFNRFASEYRVLNTINSDVIRFRNRLGINYALNSKVNFTMSNEFILNVRGSSFHNFFDQNRTAWSADVMVFSNVKLEFGYIYLRRLPNHFLELVKEHNVFVNVSYRVK
ncbi:MAG TPA: DUF2490 domain-containing protein [Brumimicrobium sp.]|nr:DUF2490 domain-containing protein [Brumimicrobium sp.]